MLINGQAYFINLTVLTLQDFKSMFDLFSTSCIKGLKNTRGNKVSETKLNETYLTAQKGKFSTKDFFSKCDQSHRFLRILSHLLKKSSMENFIFCALHLILLSKYYFILSNNIIFSEKGPGM